MCGIVAYIGPNQAYNFLIQGLHQRNTLVKDGMRLHALHDITHGWFYILGTFEQSNPELATHCLSVIAKYVSWVLLHYNLPFTHFLSIIMIIIIIIITL